MVTFVYFLMVTLILGLTLYIDMFLYESTFLGAMFSLYKTSVGPAKWITMMMFASGFITSLIADIRLSKNKATSR